MSATFDEFDLFIMECEKPDEREPAFDELAARYHVDAEDPIGQRARVERLKKDASAPVISDIFELEERYAQQRALSHVVEADAPVFLATIVPSFKR